MNIGETLHDDTKVIMWNLEQSSKVINRKIVSRNGILHVMSDGIKVECLERHHIIP